jgi:23S rRNA (pseudouridine1915-N3)-methyltransferase
MWEIKILTVGKLKNKAIKEEVQRLVKNIRGEWKVEIASVSDSGEKEPAARIAKETGELLSKAPKGSEIIPLSPDGKMVSSGQLAGELKRLKDSGKKVCFLIGGAYGLDQELTRNKCGAPLSLSKMTFSHELSLLVLMEQIYRGYTLYNNMPYSK